MAVHVRSAGAADVPTLVGLMQAFYDEADFPLPADRAAGAFAALFADPRLGGVWLAEEGAQAVGHVVLTVCFSMEYGGLRGFIDDLYVRPAARGRGAGRPCWRRPELKRSGGGSERCTSRSGRTMSSRAGCTPGPGTPTAGTSS